MPVKRRLQEEPTPYEAPVVQRIRAARETAAPRLSQEQFGAAIGLSKPGVSALERLGQGLTVDRLMRAAQALGVHWAALLGDAAAVARDIQETELLRLFRRLPKGDRDMTIDYLRLTAERRDRDRHENAGGAVDPKTSVKEPAQ